MILRCICFWDGKGRAWLHEKSEGKKSSHQCSPLSTSARQKNKTAASKSLVSSVSYRLHLGFCKSYRFFKPTVQLPEAPWEMTRCAFFLLRTMPSSQWLALLSLRRLRDSLGSVQLKTRHRTNNSDCCQLFASVPNISQWNQLSIPSDLP